jgi:hypothetical protein
MMADHLK